MSLRVTRVVALVAILALASMSGLRGAQQASPMGTGDASISGHVAAADTRKPIRNAVVQIVIYNNLSSRFRTVLTDEQGKFEFTKLPAGEYYISAQAPRYISMQYGQQQAGPVNSLNPAAPIMLSGSQAFTTADFALPGYCAIEGVVVDEYGDPAPNVWIVAMQLIYAAGRPRLVDVGTNDAGLRPSDDLGRFRIGGLMPGSYYIAAITGAFADPTAAGGFAITFYPGTTDASAARQVTIAPSQDLLDLSFALSPAKTATVSGRLIDAGGGSVAGDTLMLMPSETTGAALSGSVRSVADSAGRFIFRNLPPGTYTIQAIGRPLDAPGRTTFGYRTFSVNGTDIDSLTIPIPAPRAVRGRLTFEGDLTKLPKPDDVQVYARPVDFESAPAGGGLAPWTVNDDWTFELTGMSGLRVIGAAVRGWVVKKVTATGRDVSDTAVDLREHDVNGVEIVLTTRASTVAGTAVDVDGKPLVGYSVVVFADDETKWGIWSRWVTFARTTAQGQFSFRGLPPGAFIAVVVPSVLSGEWQNPEFLRKQRANPDVVRFALTDEGTLTIKIVGRK